MSGPKIAVVGLPGLVQPLKDIGYDVLTDSTETGEIAREVKRAEANQQKVIVITTPPADEKQEMWLKLQVKSRRMVLILDSDQIPATTPIKNTKSLTLPSTLNDIMAQFRASARPGGEVMIDARGNVPSAAPAPDAVEDEDIWGANDFADFGDSAAPEPVANQNPFVPAADDFGDPDPQSVAKVPVSNPFADDTPAPAADPFSAAPQPQGLADPFATARQPNPFDDPAPSDPFSQPAANDPFAAAAQPPVNDLFVSPQPAANDPFAAPAPVANDPFASAPVANDPFTAPSPAVNDPFAAPAPVANDPFAGQATFTAPTPPASPIPTIGEAGIFGATKVQGGRAGNLAPVIVVFSSKGGVGKTTGTMSLAQEAADKGIKKVVVVDMNRGQGDVRKYLRMTNDSSLGTIYDAAVAVPQSAKKAILGPKHLMSARPSMLPEVGFGAVLAPRRGQADPNIVTAKFYAAVIHAAREFADLVIVDTQIVEDRDTSDLIDHVAVPLMKSPGGWGVAVSDSSMPSVTNVLETLDEFNRAGVPRDKLMMYVNRAEESSTLNMDQLSTHVQTKATFVGAVKDDTKIFESFEAGRIPNSVPAMGKVMSTILQRVTGDPAFDPRVYEEKEAPKTGGGRFSFPWSRKRG